MMQRMKGMTLVELSVVLMALGLLLLGAVMFWQLSERQRIAIVQLDAQEQSRDALIGFLHANYRLPCPAADVTGMEDCTQNRQVGFLPWQTLGLARPAVAGFRYGVYREPAQVETDAAPMDKDLAIARDRMNPLRVRTPSPIPQNADAPNSLAPPVPSLTESLLGTTQSGIDAVPLNTACNASNMPPCPLGVARAVNLIDICLALHKASEYEVAPAGYLATQVGANRRPAAFVIAAPGMLDADGNGSVWDGANARASFTNPTFEAPSRAMSPEYDDRVLAASHAELFAELHCAGALSAIAHAHMNVATGSMVLERAMYDYRDQLYIAVVLAQADVAAATAGVASAAAGVLDAAKEMLSATGDVMLSAGARSHQIALAAVGIGLAAASVPLAGFAIVDAGLSLDEAQKVHQDFAARTAVMTNLSRSVNANALTADAMGY